MACSTPARETANSITSGMQKKAGTPNKAEFACVCVRCASLGQWGILHFLATIGTPQDCYCYTVTAAAAATAGSVVHYPRNPQQLRCSCSVSSSRLVLMPSGLDCNCRAMCAVTSASDDSVRRVLVELPDNYRTDHIHRVTELDGRSIELEKSDLVFFDENTYIAPWKSGSPCG